MSTFWNYCKALIVLLNIANFNFRKMKLLYSRKKLAIWNSVVVSTVLKMKFYNSEYRMKKWTVILRFLTILGPQKASLTMETYLDYFFALSA